MEQAQRAHVVFSGNVQGVGFRFTAEKLASQNEVTGFVKNLPDGRVEIVCEATQDQLESFLYGIEKDMDGYISDSQVKWEPKSGEFSLFEIRF
ncbi:MAG: acylphosphatase [Candidatus Omnitrophota bacterium]